MNTKNFNDNFASIKEEVLSQLKKNKNQIVKTKELHRTFDLSAIQFRKVIHSLRCDAQPIIAISSGGYKYSDDIIEITLMRVSLIRRAKQILLAAEGLNKYLNEH